MKRNTLLGIIIVIAVLVVAGVAYGMFGRNNDTNDKKTTGQTASSAQDNSTSPELGQKIDLSDWGISFQLPKTIDVTELRTAHNPTSKFDGIMIGDSVVASNYNPAKCQGNSPKFGEIFTIMQYNTSQYGGTKIGDSYYKVMEPAATEECYSSPIWQKYFEQSVRTTAQQTLKANE